jgi:hypothetical protein
MSCSVDCLNSGCNVSPDQVRDRDIEETLLLPKDEVQKYNVKASDYRLFRRSSRWVD